MTHITCRLTTKNRDQLRNPTLCNRVWAIAFLLTAAVYWKPKQVSDDIFGSRPEAVYGSEFHARNPTNTRTHGRTDSSLSRVNCRQHYFAVRVLRIWNSLPEDVVSAAHLSLFISRLVQVNLNQFLIGKM